MFYSHYLTSLYNKTFVYIYVAKRLDRLGWIFFVDTHRWCYRLKKLFNFFPTGNAGPFRLVNIKTVHNTPSQSQINISFIFRYYCIYFSHICFHYNCIYFFSRCIDDTSGQVMPRFTSDFKHVKPYEKYFILILV